MSDAAAPMPPATETPPEETPPVDIHKIKPIHSWRDFGKELGTIVLGIIIAISLEHMVESWNWDREVTKARKALQSEIATNNGNFALRRIAQESCLNRQMQEAAAILTDLEARRPPGHFTTFHSTNGGPMTSGEWEAQRAAQTLTHFPDDELAMMSRYYNWVASFQDWVNGEGAAWSDLSVLRNPSADFGSADIIRLQGRLAAAQRFNGLIQLNSRRVLKLADDLGVPRKAADPMRLRLYCNSNEEEYFETIRKMEP